MHSGVRLIFFLFLNNLMELQTFLFLSWKTKGRRILLTSNTVRMAAARSQSLCKAKCEVCSPPSTGFQLSAHIFLTACSEAEPIHHPKSVSSPKTCCCCSKCLKGIQMDSEGGKQIDQIIIHGEDGARLSDV